jgi:hypothetical protein
VEGLGLSAVAVGVGIAAAISIQLAVALIAIVLLCLYVGYATNHPRGAVIAMFASLVLIPVYAVPTFRSFSPEPTAVAAVALALAFFRVGVQLRFTAVDLTFAATCGAMVLAALLGPHGLLPTLSELFLWVPPYLAGRAICKRRDGAHTFVLAAALAGLISLPFLAYETITRHNPFFALARANTELTKLWAHPAFRTGGLLRSQGAFGHPLSMTVIVGSCAVFALALVLRTHDRRRQAAWLLVAIGLALGQYTSHERSGWIVLIGGLLVFAATAIPRETRIRHAFTVAMVSVPLALLAVSASHPSNGEESVQRAESSAERIALWRHALEPGVLAPLGLPETNTENHFTDAIRPGSTAIDSGYLQVGDVFGFIALIALFTVVATVVRVAVALRGNWAAVVPAVALANLIALTVIGFQTQVPIFVWLVIGAVSGVDLRRRFQGSEP